MLYIGDQWKITSQYFLYPLFQKFIIDFATSVSWNHDSHQHRGLFIVPFSIKAPFSLGLTMARPDKLFYLGSAGLEGIAV